MADAIIPESMKPKDGDPLWEQRSKSNLAAKMAREFATIGNGQGLEACMAVLVEVATNPTYRARVRANAAKALLDAAARASAAGTKVAVQVNAGGGEPAAGPARDRGFWQAALADPEARGAVLAGLSAQLGVPPPVKATVPASSVVAKPVEKAAAPVRRTTVGRKASA